MYQDPLKQNNPFTPQKKGVPSKGPDNALLGLLIGLLFPLLGVALLYFLWGNNASFAKYLAMFVTFDFPSQMNASSKVLSLSVIANLIPFYFFLNRRRYQTVKGLLISMVLFFVLIVLYKFVWQ